MTRGAGIIAGWHYMSTIKRGILSLQTSFVLLNQNQSRGASSLIVQHDSTKNASKEMVIRLYVTWEVIKHSHSSDTQQAHRCVLDRDIPVTDGHLHASA